MLRLMLLPISGLMLMASHSPLPQGQAPAPDAEKKVCRMLTTVGTIIPKRTCLTKAEWKKLFDASENGNENYRNRTSIGCNRNGTLNSCAGPGPGLAN
ncbi:hypothetical protein HZY97_05730 [Sphingomonas sp. R-74633]|uniref:hypothetical protein n=1 Tax=Sphingomonas sp. R-74633 TaxID=2751188 RepID=UPI0015D45758|nr:hypothetical protein [Sphingomonas sp. R-74633]NYT40247.1 hypothetical protein [Sphingomonas sp. R-74633]